MLQNLWLQVGKAMAGVREREDGQALVEYALILALIAVVTIAVLQAIGVNVSKILNKVSTSLSSVAG